jgi:hypothetical protein
MNAIQEMIVKQVPAKPTSFRAGAAGAARLGLSLYLQDFPLYRLDMKSGKFGPLFPGLSSAVALSFLALVLPVILHKLFEKNELLGRLFLGQRMPRAVSPLQPGIASRQ